MAGWNDDAMPVDVAFARELSLAGQLRVDKVKFCGLTANAVSAKFDAQRAALHIAPITARTYGGGIDAAISIDAAEAPRLSTRGTLSDVDLRAARADVAHLPWLEGRAELAWDVHAEGGSVSTLRAGLAGPVSLAVRAGKIAGIDLRSALLEAHGELGKQLPARQQDFNAGVATPFSEMKARVEVREGRAKSTNIEFHTSAIHAEGAGELSLDSGLIELRLNASVNRTAQEFATLAGLIVPIQVDGPWRLPRFTLDFPATNGGTTPHLVDAAAEPVGIARSSVALSALAPRAAPLRARR
jgi:uncharacterized protein involved in outer membrane biogenesis